MAISPQGVVRSTSCLVLRGVFGVGGSNGAISGVTTFNMYVEENNARGVIRLVTILSISFSGGMTEVVVYDENGESEIGFWFLV